MLNRLERPLEPYKASEMGEPVRETVRRKNGNSANHFVRTTEERFG